MTVNDELHHLVDTLDEEQAQQALTYLQQLQPRRDAPIDHQSEPAEEPTVVLESEDELGGDEVITTDEAKRRLQGPGE